MTLPNHNTALEEILDKLGEDFIEYSVAEVREVWTEDKKAAVAAINKLMYEETLALIPKDWPVDSNADKSPLVTFNKARNSAYAEMRKAAAERFGQE